jgi:hypothetical protein
VKRLFLLLLWLVPAGALAHRASDSYLALSVQGRALQGHWDVALSDLVYALELEPASTRLSWGALRAETPRVERILSEGLRFHSAAGACRLTLHGLSLVQLSDGRYARVPFEAECPDARELRVRSQLLASVDRDHRTLVRLGAAERAATHVLSAERPTLALGPSTAPGTFRVLLQQIANGLVHIFEGADHIAFLLVLLLPAVLARPRTDAPKPASSRPARVRVLLDVVKVVSAFTLAHSLTLSLAALGLVRVSAALIEPAIAASVALAALGNLWPRHAPTGPSLAFVLGLLHGFGFASVLSDAGLSEQALVSSLLGFNLGVELGQLLIVALFVPLASCACRLRLWRDHALSWGSSAVLVLALLWVFQRLQTG